MHAFVHKACISEEMKYLLVSTTCKLLNTSYLETKQRPNKAPFCILNLKKSLLSPLYFTVYVHRFFTHKYIYIYTYIANNLKCKCKTYSRTFLNSCSTRCPICRESFAHKLEKRPPPPPGQHFGKKQSLGDQKFRHCFVSMQLQQKSTTTMVHFIIIFSTHNLFYFY